MRCLWYIRQDMDPVEDVLASTPRSTPCLPSNQSLSALSLLPSHLPNGLLQVVDGGTLTATTSTPTPEVSRGIMSLENTSGSASTRLKSRKRAAVSESTALMILGHGSSMDWLWVWMYSLSQFQTSTKPRNTAPEDDHPYISPDMIIQRPKVIYSEVEQQYHVCSLHTESP